MKKRNIIIGLLVIFSLIILYTVYYNSINAKISRDLDSNIPITLDFEYEDTHHWFLGDGATIAESKVNDEQIDRIVNNSNREWLKTPIPEELETRVYGNDFSKGFIPQVKNGYWTFLDRYRAEREDGIKPNIYYGNPGNYSLGVVDLDTNTLYYIKSDS